MAIQSGETGSVKGSRRKAPRSDSAGSKGKAWCHAGANRRRAEKALGGGGQPTSGAGGVLEGLQQLLQSLDGKLRRTVLATRFTEAQRLALEKWMLSRPADVAKPPRRKRLARERLPGRKAKKVTQIAQARSLLHRPGLIVHPRKGSPKECYYSVVITIGRLRLLTKEHQSLEVAQGFHAALVAVKKKMEGVGTSSFECRFREVLSSCLDEHNLEPRAMGLRFCVCLAALWLPRPLVTPPFTAEGEAMDAGLRAWRRLGEARGEVLHRGSVLQVLSPQDIDKSWARIRQAYLEVVEEASTSIDELRASKQREAAAARLEALEAAQGGQRDRQLERWNRRQMAQEEAIQRRWEAEKPKRVRRKEGTRSIPQNKTLRAVDRLLRVWSRQVKLSKRDVGMPVLMAS
mmetsp:Transcript_17507/g.30634  ORF Transcript_17507/g.30634 Transcript_17507/m.30634 type:complete len:403 (+) Transcript_17507:249-1457(+)